MMVWLPVVWLAVGAVHAALLLWHDPPPDDGIHDRAYDAIVLTALWPVHWVMVVKAARSRRRGAP